MPREAKEVRMRRIRRQRVLAGAAAVAVIAIVVGLVSRSSSPQADATRSTKRAGAAATPGALVLRSGSTTLARLPLASLADRGRLSRARVMEAVAHAIPAHAVVHRARARITVAYDRATALRDAAAITVEGGTVQVHARPIAATVPTTVVKQVLPNDCEATALQMLLAGVGVHMSQLALQRRFPRSGPLDPEERGSQQIWGDPELGFVGRPEGGGAAGGFGIYQRPVARVARSLGVTLDDLTGGSPQAVYSRLLAGHAVMVWIGLSDGPTGTWTSPQGRPVTVNFGEHSVVVHGISRDGTLTVADPLTGTTQRWTPDQFRLLWDRLGRRALST
jgi:uncharacterized protein YvpB